MKLSDPDNIRTQILDVNAKMTIFIGFDLHKTVSMRMREQISLELEKWLLSSKYVHITTLCLNFETITQINSLKNVQLLFPWISARQEFK